MHSGQQLAARIFVGTAAPSPHRPPDAVFLRLIKFWVWLSALAAVAGWGLSAIGQLNRPGYAVFFVAAAAIFFVVRSPSGWNLPAGRGFLCRFRRPLPGAFAGLALLILAGSIIYPPSNYTGLNYHLGRVLQWIAHGQWWWVHTSICRMNYCGCAFEWLTTPVVLFTQSDRAIFLVNYLPFLLMPGLIFSVFTRLGVRSRVAWVWMWLLPTGYNFLLQSGSIGNDTFAVIFALAAIDFGCRAWESRRVGDLWHSLLAVALLTGTKPVSLPLMLPWAVLIFPLLPLLRQRWLATLPVMVMAGVASFIPIALLNQKYSGDWLGRTVEITHKEIHQPLIGIMGNALQLFLGNFVPPVFPLAGWWNDHALSLLPQFFVQRLAGNFEGGIYIIGEVPTEDWVGIGFGLSLLLVVSVIGSWWLRQSPPSAPVNRVIPLWLRRCVLVTPWVSLLAFAMKSGINTAPRLVSSYYLLLIPVLLVGAGQSQIIRQHWWRWLAGGVLALALLVLVVSPDRPLWPAKMILSHLQKQHPGQKSIARALQVYTVYSQRNDVLAGVRNLLPPDLKVVGFIGDGDDCDISLWRPFGSRRVEHFFLTDPPAQVRLRVEYVVLGSFNLQMQGVKLDAWLAGSGAELVATTNITLKAGIGPQPWYVARFKPQYQPQ
jgi:hypothetical protein